MRWMERESAGVFQGGAVAGCCRRQGANGTAARDSREKSVQQREKEEEDVHRRKKNLLGLITD